MVLINNIPCQMQHTQVVNEMRTPNLGTELTCMVQCGDSLLFGGANGFVGLGVGVPHQEGGDGNGVAIMCIFPAPSGSKENTPTAEDGSDKQHTHPYSHPQTGGGDLTPNTPGVRNGTDTGISDPGSPVRHPSSDTTKTKHTVYTSPDPAHGSRSLYIPSDLSVLRMRGHGYYSNITCLASEPCPLESGESRSEFRSIGSIVLCCVV